MRSIALLGRTSEWIPYDFPEGLPSPKSWKGLKGQRQQWFAFRLTGHEDEIDLNAHGEPEFDAWRWGRLEEAPSLIVPFKRPVYEQVARVFGEWAV